MIVREIAITLLNACLANPWLLKNNAMSGSGMPMLPQRHPPRRPTRKKPSTSLLILKFTLLIDISEKLGLRP
jgi:hypothetical protein